MVSVVSAHMYPLIRLPFWEFLEGGAHQAECPFPNLPPPPSRGLHLCQGVWTGR